MSLSATLFGRDSLIFKATNILGLGIPGWLDKTFGAGDTPGPALGELAQQTAKEGESRAIVWGRVRPLGGNITHCQAPIKRWVKEKTSGGKGGGGKKTQKVEHVYRTYAIGVCEGPITGYSRIWRNNKLVYDARGNAWGNTNNPVFLRQYRLYTGSWSQMPDPTLQSIWGANIPAYRGTAYIVAVNEDLTDLGGSVPQWLFEVERAEGIFYTSRPYAAEDIAGVSGRAEVSRLRDPFHLAESAEEIGGAVALEHMSFRSLQLELQVMDEVGGGISAAALSVRRALATYELDDAVVGGCGVPALVVRRAVISYIDPTGPDQLTGGAAVQGLRHERT